MPNDAFFASMEVSATGLTANRRWMDAIAENLANAQTTRTPEGGPYKRKIVTFSEIQKKMTAKLRLFEPKIPLTLSNAAHLSPSSCIKSKNFRAARI